jgi:hypothetical protein
MLRIINSLIIVYLLLAISIIFCILLVSNSLVKYFAREIKFSLALVEINYKAWVDPE